MSKKEYLFNLSFFLLRIPMRGYEVAVQYDAFLKTLGYESP